MCALVGLGLRKLSMSASQLAKVKRALSRHTAVQLQRLAGEILACEDAGEVLQCMQAELALCAPRGRKECCPLYRRTTTVINRPGLHARPASQFTNAAQAFDSRISIRNLSLKEQDNTANAKSIISVLTLALVQGSEVELTAEGPDEQQAEDVLIELIDGGFGVV